ncbi:DUF4184 family protein [Streptomyces sp. BI20]|uniref:DUF4184 family protein n=1 Tax=Streptomyces sp. BI20 TaxID=3403460 RepID=UPI003C77A11C
MPFTLSHAAAVLPALRRTGRARGPLVASGLVCGSFAPDTVYFAESLIPGAMSWGTFTHSLPGILTADLALTALLAAAWAALRGPLLALAPARLRSRAHPLLRGEPWRTGPDGLPPTRSRAVLAAWFACSAVLGSITHVVWDAFTHHDRWGTDLVPVLNRTVAGLPAHSWVQYGSSALAALILLGSIAHALRHSPAPRTTPDTDPGTRPAPLPVLRGPDRLLIAGWLLLAVAIGVAFRVRRFYSFFDRADTPLDLIPTVCFGAGAGLAPALLLYALWAHLRRTAPRTPGTA